MKLYLLLLWVSAVIAKPMDQGSKVPPPLSDEAKEFLKSMHGKIGEILADYLKSLRNFATKDKAIQAGLAELRKPEHLELKQKALDTKVGKELTAQALKYKSILLFTIRNDLLDPLKDLAKEHPGVKPDFGNYTRTQEFYEHLKRLNVLISDELKLTEFDKRDGPFPYYELPEEFKKLFRYYDTLNTHIESTFFFFLRDLQIRKHLFETGALTKEML